MTEITNNLIWVAIFTLSSALVGVLLVFAATVFIPRFLDKITPQIDEAKEIAKGNQAVASYFGRLVSACIIGVSIVIAAAVFGGLFVLLR